MTKKTTVTEYRILQDGMPVADFSNVKEAKAFFKSHTTEATQHQTLTLLKVTTTIENLDATLGEIEVIEEPIA